MDQLIINVHYVILMIIERNGGNNAFAMINIMIMVGLSV